MAFLLHNKRRFFINDGIGGATKDSLGLVRPLEVLETAVPVIERNREGIYLESKNQRWSCNW